MKNLNRRYSTTLKLIVVFAVVALLNSACSKDFLDRPTQGEYTEGTYPYTPGSGPYDPTIFEAYNGLRAYGVHAIGFVAATSIRSDDADKGSTPADGPSSKQFDDFEMTPTNGLLNIMWTDHYNLIERCNRILKEIRLDQSPLTDPAAKLSGQAEARFLRAYAYFMMVRYFGNIPLIDSIPDDESSSLNVPQSTPAQIYNFIENDLQFAAANLPPSWESKYIGRVTKGAAYGLLAKVYITQSKWGPAKNAAEMVINSKQYDLSTKYDDIFSEIGENSKESVFEVQATVTDTEKRGKYGVQYASDQGVRGISLGSQWNLGNGFNSPSLLLVNAYEAGDPRKNRTILTSPGTTYYNEQLGTLTGMAPRFNQKVLSSPAYRSKYRDTFGWWMNVRILRYADVVLMYAEAANELGGAENTQEALEKLEMVRFRARNGRTDILPKVVTTDQEELRQAIRHERRIELAMEHDRFYDLVRWGIAGQVLQSAGKNFVTGRDELLPIPQAQRDISNLTQNFGW